MTTDHANAMRALGVANDIRTSRALLKRDLRAGRQSPGPLLDDPPDCIRTMTITAFLRALPRYGPHRVQRTLVVTSVAPLTRLAALTERQRAALIAATDHL